MLKSPNKTPLATQNNFSDEDLNRITALQRMIKENRAHQKPGMDGVDYSWIVGSNEPDTPSLAKYDHGKFALVGCGVLRSVEAIFQLMDKNAYQGSLDGYTNVPKLFVVDFSSHVMEAWRRLKSLMPKVHSKKELITEMVLMNFFNDLNVTNSSGIPNALKFLARLDTFCQTEKDFELFKNIVSKATLICDDWLDPKVLHYVKDHVEGQPLCVYASNIPEYIKKVGDIPPSFIVDQIVKLNPAFTVYASTDQVWGLISGLRPSIISVVEGADKNRNLQGLRCDGDSYLSRYIPEQNAESHEQPSPENTRPQYKDLKKGFLSGASIYADK